MNMHSPISAAADAVITTLGDRAAKRHQLMRRRARAATRGFPGLEAMAEAWIVFDAEHDKLLAAYGAAETALNEAHRVGNSTEALEKSEARAERAYERANNQADERRRAVLETPVDSIPEALAKQSLFAAMWGAKDATELPFNEDTQAALAALMRDLQGLVRDTRAWDAALADYQNKRAAFDAHNDRPDRADEDEEEELWLSLSRALDAALRVLMDTPSPHAEAHAMKHVIARREVFTEDVIDLDDPASVAAAEADWTTYVDVRLAQDALQLAGIDHPCVRVRFNPQAWVEAYEALGGYVTAPTETGLYIGYPHRSSAAEDRATADALEAEITAVPWKHRAVQQYARSRRGTGGDPLFHHDGTLKPKAPQQDGVLVRYDAAFSHLMEHHGGHESLAGGGRGEHDLTLQHEVKSVAA